MLTDQDVQMTVDTYQQILIRADTIFQNEEGIDVVQMYTHASTQPYTHTHILHISNGVCVCTSVLYLCLLSSF